MTGTAKLTAEPCRQISGSITGVLVGYVRLLLGETGVERLLALAGEERPAAELEDTTQWSSYADALRLFHAAAAITDDPDIARSVGAHLLNQHAGTEVAALLRSLGSTKELLRNVASTASKYSTVTTMEAIELLDDEALVSAVTSPEIKRHRHFCLYTAGVLSQAAVLFGHDPAEVEEIECQTRGDHRCLYRVTWSSDTGDDPLRRIADLETQLSGLAGRFEALQATATAFTTATSVDEVLDVVTSRAGVAVRAPRFVLAVQLPTEHRQRLHFQGFGSREEAQAVADDILSGGAEDRATRLVVEVMSSRSRFGILAAIQPEGLRFFPQERQLLQAYAAQAAAALEVAAALEDARRQNETARALLSFGRSLAEVATTELIVERLVSTLPSVVACDSGAVLLWDSDAEVLRMRTTFGLPVEVSDSFAGLEVRFDDTPTLKVLIEQREPVFISRSTDDPFVQGMMERAQMQSAALVPILAHDEVLGVAAVGMRDDVFGGGADVIERLSGMADLAATAFVNAKFLEAAQKEAMHDPLTGLGNTRLLAKRAEHALHCRTREMPDVALLFIDLDGFKPVNDELGHEAGDEVLRICAARLSGAVREGDTVARLGGDEFVVLMPTAGRQAAEGTARRLRDLLGAPFAVSGKQVCLSASVGVAISSVEDEFASLLKRADEAMYSSKPGRSRLALR